MRAFFLTFLMLAGCGRSDLIDEASGTPTTPAPETTNPAPACRTEITTDTALRFDFPTQRCQFSVAEAAAGLTFRYGLEVTASESRFVETYPSPLQTCAQPNDSNLYVLERVLGGGQSYCLCDGGRCVRPGVVFGATPGRREFTFAWDGRNWNGPSDTGNPKGAPFPPGEYALTLEATVGDARADGPPRFVTAKFFITLTP